MLLSINLSAHSSRFSDKEAIKMIADAGFDAFDLSLFRMNKDPEYQMNKENFREYAMELRKTAGEAGIVCNQAHAPFPSSYGNEKDEEVFGMLIRAMEAASILGAKIIVIHPCQHLKYVDNRSKLKEINLEFYKKLLPYCEKFGIKIATENMWQTNRNTNRIIDSVCSRADEFCEYIDMINSENLVACLDIGHVALVDENLHSIITKLGHNRLKALHVHDNDFVNDSHTAPFDMRINFSEVAKSLAEIDYDGDFTFETEGFFKNLPDELMLPAAKYLCEIGRYLIKEIEKNKN